MSVLNYPLSNVQMELLKLFSTNLSDNELSELKDLLSKHFAEKAIAKADIIWREKNLSDDVMERWLNAHNQ